MNELCVMDTTGDSKTIWNPANADEVSAARATFDALKKKRYLAYSVKPDGEKGELIDAFDPAAGKIIMSPMMAGG
jgi:hypothetical protein